VVEGQPGGRRVRGPARAGRRRYFTANDVVADPLADPAATVLLAV
jgi:hypothetical protein